MGIKGIYKEIGSGKRISLTKLAVEKLEQSGRPLRLAIDISIWQFQVQAARGGSNPAIRTLFYRLVRLLGLSIQPIFVFDGPNKPIFKRNKRSGRGDGVATSMAKRLIRLFGFQVHDAPGEAEAECALLQKHGIVDAVISEDVDTIMFGCTRTLRNWSAEGTKGSKTPTHISMYDTAELCQGESGLDREGMVLVALVSGGDYLPEGIPGAGVKLACEAARAGFGKSLCRLKMSDATGLTKWRENLKHELQTNESRLFRTKHKALVVPEDFPNVEVLRYYTHPVVSPASVVDRLKSQNWSRSLDVLGLRDFVRETFDWDYKGGAIKFVRVLAPGLLVRKLMEMSSAREVKSQDLQSLEKEQSGIVRSITTRRSHFSTDATPELRISFIPTKIVGYNFEEEPDEEITYGRDGLALNSDDEFEALANEEGAKAVAKTSSRKPFSPTESDLSWIPETIAKLGIPLMVEDWEQAQRAKASRQKTKAPAQKAKGGGMATGALDKYVKVSKSLPADLLTSAMPAVDKLASSRRSRSPRSTRPASTQGQPTLSLSVEASLKSRTPARPITRKQPKSKSTGIIPSKDQKTNPWTIAGSQYSPKTSKPKTASVPAKSAEAIFISSSPPALPAVDASSPVRQNIIEKEGSDKENNLPVTNLHNRRSTTPVRDSSSESRSDSALRASSPTQRSGERSRRKLARTESLRAGRERLKTYQSGARAPRDGLTRSRTAAEPVFSDIDDDSEFPPISSFAGWVPKASPVGLISPRAGFLINTKSAPLADPGIRAPASATSSTSSLLPAPVARLSALKKHKEQLKLNDVFEARTTKLYVPRKSAPGYIKEVEVTVEEAERLGRDNKRGHWRRSHVNFIDLTGED